MLDTMKLDCDGKNIYITGGSSGIGLAFGKHFAANGANIFICSMDDEDTRLDAISQIKSAAKNKEQTFDQIALDVSDREAVKDNLTDAAKTFGPPYIIINSAGIGGAVPFEKMPFERFDSTIKINLYGIRHVINTLLPFMKEQGQGHILNVASFSGIVGIYGYTAYSSSKFAVVGFSEALRAELKPHGIMVAVLCPPQVDTPLLRKTDVDKPPETKAINDRAGVLDVDCVITQSIKGMQKGRFLIIPGARAKFFHLFNRLLPRLREKMADNVIRKVRKGRN